MEINGIQIEVDQIWMFHDYGDHHYDEFHKVVDIHEKVVSLEELDIVDGKPSVEKDISAWQYRVEHWQEDSKEWSLYVVEEEVKEPEIPPQETIEI